MTGAAGGGCWSVAVTTRVTPAEARTFSTTRTAESPVVGPFTSATVLDSANPSVRVLCCCGVGQTAGAVTGMTVAGVTEAAADPAVAGPSVPPRRARATGSPTDDSRRRPKASAPALAADPAAVGTARAARGPPAPPPPHKRTPAPPPRPAPKGPAAARGD